MHRVNAALLGLAVLVPLVVSASALASDPDDAPPEIAGECVKLRAEARYEGLGYRHVVHVDNTCSKTVSCQVWTSVDATRHDVVVAASQSSSVTTRASSPARSFAPQAECKF